MNIFAVLHEHMVSYYFLGEDITRVTSLAAMSSHIRWCLAHDGYYEGPVPISMYME